MKIQTFHQATPRRGFLGSLASGVAALGSMAFTSSLPDEKEAAADEAEEYFDKINGTQKIVFDVTRPHEALPFAWPRMFLITNGNTGVPENECSVVVVFRHDAIPYAFHNKLWKKYGFGKMFKADDPLTKAPSLRNPFWKPATGDFKIPGIGNVAIGINELQDSGVLFCVCDVAISIHSATAADAKNKNAAEMKKEWISELLPGIKVVPSGDWAIGRAQEHGCSYCFAG